MLCKPYTVNVNGLGEALERNRADVPESQRLADAQFRDRVGDEDLLRIGMGTKSESQIHRRPEQIVVVLDRFACGHADPDAQRLLGMLAAVLQQISLHVDRAANRGSGRNECRHDPVAGVLHLASVGRDQPGAHDAIMNVDDIERHVVSELLRHAGRADDVGEQDRARARIAFPLARQQSSARVVDFRRTHEGIRDLGCHLHDPCRRQPMRLTVDRVGRLGARRVAQAEDLSLLLVQPVLDVLHAVRCLHVQVLHMRAGNAGRSHARNVVNVHVHRHADPPGRQCTHAILASMRDNHLDIRGNIHADELCALAPSSVKRSLARHSRTPIDRCRVPVSLWIGLRSTGKLDRMTTPTISRYPVPELEALPEDIRARMLDVHDKAGFIPNVFLTMAHRPAEFRAFFAYHDALMEKESGLTKAEREMIVVATSAANDCLYCIVAHGAILRIYAKNPLVADQVAANYRKADISPRQKAMLAFAMKVAVASPTIDADDFPALHTHGFSDEDIWDIGAIAAFFALSNRMANLISMRPNDEFFIMGRVPREKPA